MSSLFGSGRIPITDSWRAGFDVQLVSNKTYLKRYELSNLDRLTSTLFSDAVSGRSRGALAVDALQIRRLSPLSSRGSMTRNSDGKFLGL